LIVSNGTSILVLPTFKPLNRKEGTLTYHNKLLKKKFVVSQYYAINLLSASTQAKPK